MKSDTPRTDSAEFFVATTPKLSPDEGEMHVTAFFARQLERELNEAKLRNTELTTHLSVAMTMLAGAGSGREYDPSWIRPKQMSLREIQDAAIQAYHYLHKASQANITP